MEVELARSPAEAVSTRGSLARTQHEGFTHKRVLLIKAQRLCLFFFFLPVSENVFGDKCCDANVSVSVSS